MTGVVLAAGAGSRLGELGKRYSKPMVPLGGRPLIDWVIEALQSAGVAHFIVVAHPSDRALSLHLSTSPVGVPAYGMHASQTQTSAAHAASPHAEVVFQPERRGIADALRLALPLLGNQPGCLACACDSLFADIDLWTFVAAAHAHPRDAWVAVLQMGMAATRSRSAVVLQGDRVVEIIEKPLPGSTASGMVALPLYWLPRDFEPFCAAAESSGESYVTSALQSYVSGGGTLRAVRFRTRIEVTRAEDIPVAEAWLQHQSTAPERC